MLQHATPASRLNSALRGGIVFSDLILFNHMFKKAFTKPWLSHDDQIQLLLQRGLKIPNRKKTRHLLEHICYYRMSAYWYPLLTTEKEAHQFKPNARFEDAFNLYCFDRELRKIVISELEKIEISFRSTITNMISEKHNPFWYTDQSHFININTHKESLRLFKKEIENTKEQSLVTFQSKYTNPFPPSWMTLEISSFGHLSRLYKNFKHRTIKKEISQQYNLPDTLFTSWMHSLSYLRNICAHHARLWNREISITPAYPRKEIINWPVNPEIKNNTTFFLLSIIAFLLQTVHPKNSFAEKITALIIRYPSVDLRPMGFPDDWQKETLWKTSLLKRTHLRITKRGHKIVSRLR